MHREHRLVGVGHAVEQLANGLGVLVRNRVANRIRDIDGARARVDGRLNDAAKEIDFGATGVLAGKLHITAQIACALDRMHGLFDHLIRLHA